MTRRGASLRLILSFCIIALLGCALIPSHTNAAINPQINFQGKLANPDGTNVTDGTYSIVFSIYSVSSGGAAIWTETQGSVTVTSGIFQVALGSVTALPGSVDFNTSPLYLGVKVGADAEMTPRIQFTATPYAFNADKLGGIASSGYVQLSPGAQQTGNINVSGTITAGSTYNSNTFTSSTLQFGAGGTATVDSASGQALQIGTGTNAHNVTVGNATSTSTLTLQAGTGNVVLQNQGTGSVSIANNAVNNTVNIGGTGSGSNTTSVNIATATGAAQTVIIGSASNTTSTLTLQGGNGASAAIALSTGNNGTTAGGITIGNTTGAFTQAIALGTNSTASSTTNVNIGSSVAGTTAIAGTTTVSGRTTDSSSNTAFAVTNAGTGYITKFIDSNGPTTVFSLADGGAASFQNQTNTTTAFQVLNAAGGQIANIDSTGANANNLLTNTGIESAISGNWTLKGSAAAAQSSAQAYEGTNSLFITTTALANDGTKQNVTLANSTAYSASFYIKLDSTSASMATLAAGYSSDGATDNTACTLNTATVVASGWTKVTCNFTTPASNSGTPYFYIKQTDAAIHKFYIDAVLLQTDTNTDTNYRSGKLAIQGAIVSPLVLQNSVNSSNALLVENAAGTSVFDVSTTNNTNIITNPGFEAGTSGWAYSGTPGSISRDTSQSWSGNASLNITTSANANNGAKFVTGNAQPTQLALSSTYTISWYAKLSSGTFTDMIAAYAVDGSTDTTCTGINSQTVSTAGWARYSCTITTTASVPVASAYVKIMQTAGTARTFWIDGVQLEAGGTATGYGAGSFSLNGVIASPVDFKNNSNSTEAFKVQNSASVNLFQIDSLNNRVYVGNSVADATGTLLVLDTKNTTGEPTEVDGGMYYNSFYAQYRCGRDGNWENCGINPIDRGFVIEDEFMAGAVSATSATPGFGGANWTGYTVGATACAAYTYNNAGPPTPSSDHPGIIRMATGAAANTGCNLLQSTTTGGSMTIAAGMTIKMSTAVGNAAINTVLQRVGATSETTVAGRTNSGVWWEADPTTNANWQYCFGTGAAATCAASATAIAANTIVRLEIRVTATGAGVSSATFIINGVSSTVSAVTIDAATRVSPNLECTNSGTGAVSQNCYIDYYQIRGIASAAR